MFEITPRLRCIINHTNASTVADIGCDHAYVPITLINENRAKKVIACDINKGPLTTAYNNILKYNKQDFIETRLGSGLSQIKTNEADMIIIAGMGGELIWDIIKNDINTAYASKLLLQPMNAQHLLRKNLIENGFFIANEDIAIEGFKVYNIMEVEKGEFTPFKKEIYYHIPPYLKNHKFYNNLIEKKKREFTKIITGLEKALIKDEEKLKIYKNLYEEMEKYCL